MPATMEAPKQASKQEEFVQKQIESARNRIRTLDYFSAGLMLAIFSLAFIVTVLLIDHYVEVPDGTRWLVGAFYCLCASVYLYFALFRPSRRHINPFYAARQVEQSIVDAKNSVINYVDLQDDEKVPASVKTAIGNKAAKDLKQVDLNQVINKKQILWLSAVAAIFLIGAVIAAFLPPTRTTMVLLAPKEGDTTILQGEDFGVQVKLKGRIPDKSQPDAARLRLWYNPEDPTSYEERLLEPDENDKNLFSLIIPASQVRNGFHFKILAGNAQTSDYQVKVRIIPQFTGWKVSYKFPDYLKRESDTAADPNLVGNFGTQATVTAFTNRPVKSGIVEVEGKVETIPGERVDDNPEAIRFQIPMDRSSTYRIRFITTDGDSNPDPQRYRITLLDPKPVFLSFDVTFDYPKYLHYEPSTTTINVRDPHLEAMRGTKVMLLAHANRPIKDATIFQFPGLDRPIVGELVQDNPMQVKFHLPALMEDGAYRVGFSPKTDEKESDPRVYNIHVLSDEKPKVEITKPNQEEVELPANGTLAVEGIATDDVGIAKMNLRMEVVSPGRPIPLAPKPYRNGMSFKRDMDGTYPTRIDYKDFVELTSIKPEGEAGAGFRLQPGMVVEYWLEAIDNCDVPPGPNSGMSRKQRIKILPPEMNPEKQKQQQKEKQDLQKDKQQHDQQQDKQNANEKREPKKAPQQQNDQQQENSGTEPKKNMEPKKGGMEDKTMQPMMGDPMNDQELDNQKEQVEKALGQKDPKSGMGRAKDQNPDPKMDPKSDPNNQSKSDPKADPKSDPNNQSKSDPKADPNNQSKSDPKADPKSDPNNQNKSDPKADPKMGGMPSEMNQDPKQLPNPEDFQKLADKLNSKDPKEKEKAREQLKQMMNQANKEPQKPEDAQKKLDEHREKLNEEQKQKFDKAMEQLNKEMQDLQREDQVKKAADKAKSDDPMERAEGQKQIENALKNPTTRDKVEQQLQRLAGDTPDERKRNELEDAVNQSHKNIEKQEQDAAKSPMPKKEGQDTAQPTMPKKEDVDELAKKIQKGTKDEKQEAQDKLEKMMKDPKTGEQVKKQLDDFKNSLKDEQAKKDFDQSMKQMNDNVAKKGTDSTQPSPKPEDIQKFADKLQSNDPDERKQAQKQLEEAMKQADQNPESRQQAQKQLDKTRDSIKDPMKKEQFDQAVKQINDAVEKSREEQRTAQMPKKEAIDQVAKDLQSGDPMKKQAAQDALQQMLQDAKNRGAVKDQLDKEKQGLNDETAKKNIDDAIKKAEENIAKKEAGGANQKLSPEDVQKVAKDLQSDDPMKKQAAQDKLQQMLQDPNNREAVKDQLEKSKQGLNDETAKKNIDDAIKKAEENIAKKEAGSGNQKLSPEDVQKVAKGLQSDDSKERQAAQDKLQQMLQDPKNRDAVKDQLEKSKQGLNDETAKKNIDDAVKKAEENIAKNEKMLQGEIEKIADKMKNGSPDEKQQARQKLEEMLKNPLSREPLQNDLKELAKNIKDAEARKEFEKQLKEIEGKLAKNDPKIPGKKGGDIVAEKNDKPGVNSTQEAQPGALADLKNKIRAGELLLEKFEKKMTDEEFQKQLGWTPEQIAAFQKKYQQQLAALKKQLELSEKGELPQPRSVGSTSLNSGQPTKIEADPREVGKTAGGTKYIAPPGFGDPYKRFTEETSGIKSKR